MAPARAQQSGQVVGDWVLSKKADNAQRRQVTFEQKNGQLTGYYRTRTGKKVKITGARFEKNLQAFLSLAEAAKHYPCIKRAWVEFLGEPPDSEADRVDPVPA